MWRLQVLSVLFYYFLFHLLEILIADISSTMVHPAFDQEFNSFLGEMLKSSALVSGESLPAPSSASLPKAPLALHEVCKTPISNMMRQISLGSFQCWCAMQLPLPCLPVSSWNCSKCSFKLVLLPIQIPCNRAMEVETGILSLIRGNSLLCTPGKQHSEQELSWQSVGLSLSTLLFSSLWAILALIIVNLP